MPSSDTDVSRFTMAACARRTATFASARPGGLEPGHGAFADQLTLELRQRREDAKHEPACGGGGVELHTLGW